MKNNELRIGNLTMQGTVEAILEPGALITDKHCGILVDNVRPIPLTEEWLVKLGFEMRMLCFFHENLTIGRLSPIYDGTADFTFSEVTFMISNNPVVKIEHVHQLQNLYFALTGEELKTTEK